MSALETLDRVTTGAENAAVRVLGGQQSADLESLPERHASILWKCAKVTLAIWLIRAAKWLVEGLPRRA